MNGPEELKKPEIKSTDETKLDKTLEMEMEMGNDDLTKGIELHSDMSMNYEDILNNVQISDDADGNAPRVNENLNSMFNSKNILTQYLANLSTYKLIKGSFISLCKH